MTKRKRKVVPWTREHMLIALNLYFQLPFGKQHSKFPKIIELADKMGRTPGSLAMKLNNFTSLDPLEQARGIAGLPIPSLLRASHLVPWAESEEHRLDPSNGLCLAATYDAAFDCGLISFDDELKMLVSDQISQNRGDEEVRRVFICHEGNGLIRPVKNLPSLEFLSRHRKRWGFS